MLLGRDGEFQRVWYLIVVAWLTYTLHGFCNSITNGMLSLPSFIRDFPELDDITTTGETRKKNATMLGITVGLYQIGSSVGALSCFYLTGKLGRKRIIAILGIANLVGITLQLAATSLPLLMAGRTVMGLGVGAGHSTFPLYLSETVSPNIRGRAIISCALAGNLGHLLGAAVEIFFYYDKDHSTAWRIPIALELTAGIASAVMPYWTVETPQWLIWHGYYRRAAVTQSKLTGLDVDDPMLLSTLQELSGSSNDKASMSRKPPKWLWRSGMAVAIQILASMCGIDIITFFSTQIFQSQLHFSPLESRCLTLGLQACQVLWSTLAIFFVDFLGRRPLLMGAAAVMALSMGSLSGLTGADATRGMLSVSVLFLFLCMSAYPVGFHLIPSMICAEISPSTMRHEITAVAGAVHWMTDFMITLITPLAFNSISFRYYFVYMSTNILAIVLVYLLYPDTKGLTLESIDSIFRDSAGYLDIVPIARRLVKERKISPVQSVKTTYLSCEVLGKDSLSLKT